MMPNERIVDVMRRTMFNLRYIEESSADFGPYEVTQLVNSFMGAFAHPWERFKNELEKKPISVSVIEG
jgi:hypothetical protein